MISSLRRDRWIIFGLALLVRVIAALPQSQPNYMDATYYTVGGQRLAQGFGFSDPYVWNYLDQPTSLPQPSHLYWMPLPSILVAGSESIFGVSYRAAQLPFILLSAILPLITFAVTWRLTQSRRAAWIASLLTIFTAFYLPYWGVPESFAPFAVFGSLAIYLSSDRSPRRLFIAGICAGLAHLSRADGFLLLFPMILSADFGLRNADSSAPQSAIRIRNFMFVSVGYFIVMLPWFMRNFATIGAPLSSAGTQAAYICNYNEIFSYQAPLDLNHLLNCGVGQVLADKVRGLFSGLIHLIAEDGLIFLAPLIVIGWWKLRREVMIRAALIYLSLIYLVMTLVFTFAGDRGGLFHSSSALLPFFFAAVPIGLDALIARRSTWNARQARSIFGAFVVLLAIVLSVFVWSGRVIGSGVADPIWNQADREYSAIGRWLADRGEQDPIVLVNNPPAFYYHTGLRSIVIPAGDVSTLLRAADQFGATWLALDQNHVRELDDLYASPENQVGLHFRARFNSILLFEVGRP
jgi:hypothetical protein